MNEQPQFPPRWNAERVKRLIEQHDALSEDELAAEHDALANELFTALDAEEDAGEDSSPKG